jgi:hypothetical protein
MKQAFLSLMALLLIRLALSWHFWASHRSLEDLADELAHEVRSHVDFFQSVDPKQVSIMWAVFAQQDKTIVRGIPRAPFKDLRNLRRP